MNLPRRTRAPRAHTEQENTMPTQDTATLPAAPDTDPYGDAALLEAADQLEAQARDTREQSAREAEDTERQLTEARALVARLEQSARQVRGGAYGVNARADQLEQRAANYRAAVRLRGQAAGFDQAAEDLCAEAEALREQDAAYVGRLAAIEAQRAQAEVALTAARTAADVVSIAANTATISACAQAAESLEAQRRPGLDRLAAIGGEDGAGELSKALREAANCRWHVENSLNQADPQRPSAVLARERELTARAVESVAAEATAKRGNRTVQIGPDGRGATVIARRG